MGRIERQKTLDAELLDHDVWATLCDPHHAGALEALVTIRTLHTLEVQVGVELDGRLTRELSHPVFAVHLVTLLGHLELVSHVV